MHVGEKQIAQATPCELNTIHPIVRNEQYQQADDFGLHRKIFDEFKYSNRKDRFALAQRNLSLQSMNVIDTEKFPNTSSKTENSFARKYDTSISESNVIQQLEYISWKYKNPYSISINNHIDNKKSINTLENVLKKDEPQEGRTKRSILSDCREYLATYQESCGTPRTEYSYAALIVVMAQATARSLLALIYIIVNVVPVIKMFSFILRFVLDKIINIRGTKNFQQATVKFTILIIQLFSIYICLIFIFSFIILPIIQMIINIAAKLVMHNEIAIL
ncbi:hypothetical protein P5V15_003151 [Pogonomyrmex californicus]